MYMSHKVSGFVPKASRTGNLKSFRRQLNSTKHEAKKSFRFELESSEGIHESQEANNTISNSSVHIVPFGMDSQPLDQIFNKTSQFSYTFKKEELFLGGSQKYVSTQSNKDNDNNNDNNHNIDSL